MEPKKRIEVKIKSYDLPPDVAVNSEKATARPVAKVVALASAENATQLKSATVAQKKKFVVTLPDDDEVSEILDKTNSVTDEKKATIAQKKSERKPYELDDTVTRIIKEADAIKKDKETAISEETCAEESIAAASVLPLQQDIKPLKSESRSNCEDKNAVVKKDTNNKKQQSNTKGDSKKKKTKKKKYEPKNPVARFFKKFIPWGGDSAFEIIRKMILIIAFIVAVACVYIIIEYQKSTKDSEKKNDDLAQMHQQLEQNDNSADSDDGNIPIIDDEEFIPPMLGSQQHFYDINDDVIGWIEIENTRVDLPILQADDNDYYLERDIYGEYDKYGCIFADYRCLLTHNQRSDNIVLYGHDTKTDSMFGDLDQYKTNFGTIRFLREHPVIKLNSNYYKYNFVIFAVFIENTNPDEGDVWGYQNEIEFTDELDFMTFVSNCKKRSMYDTYIDVEYGEKMVTLSTCTTDLENGRLVIVGRELREGETGYEYVDNYEYNDNPLYPDMWYYYKGGSYDDSDTRYDIETLYPDAVQ